MPGYYETQVRRAMLTVGDADVLNEMATGWRASIRDLNIVDDRLKAGINGLRDHDQLGDATRDAAVGAFREMRGYVARGVTSIEPYRLVDEDVTFRLPVELRRELELAAQS